MNRVTLLGPHIFLAFAAALPAAATSINFESQAAHRGGNLTGIPDSPLTIGTATFAGGELLSGEVGLNADATGVYASEGLFGSGETNPLMIAFAVPVQNFSLLLLNRDGDRSYTVSDNLGNSITMSLPSAGALGSAAFSLPGSGVTTVAITSANVDAWNFAIDNVSFTPAATTAEPDPLLSLGIGFVLLAASRCKQLRARLGR